MYSNAFSKQWGPWRALCAVGLAADQSPAPTKSLKGSYGVLASGTVIGVGPVALVGVFNYDGNGQVTGTVIQKARQQRATDIHRSYGVAGLCRNDVPLVNGQNGVACLCDRQ